MNATLFDAPNYYNLNVGIFSQALLKTFKVPRYIINPTIRLDPTTNTPSALLIVKRIVGIINLSLQTDKFGKISSAITKL